MRVNIIPYLSLGLLLSDQYCVWLF